MAIQSHAPLRGIRDKYAQLRSHPTGRFLERNLQVISEVRASLCHRSARTRACPAKDITKPKQIAKNVFNSAEAGRAPACSRATRYTGMAKAIITLSLLCVGEHRISLGRFFELLFGRCVIRILVRVMTHSQSAISALDLLIGGGPANTKNFVIVSLTHLTLIANLSIAGGSYQTTLCSGFISHECCAQFPQLRRTHSLWRGSSLQWLVDRQHAQDCSGPG